MHPLNSDTVDRITEAITPAIQEFMRTNREELIEAGHFGPLERLYIRRAYPHFVDMTPVVVKKIVQAILNRLKLVGE